MTSSGYYSDRKYCPACDQYVRYLQSLEQSYCVDCGTRVKLFSDRDGADFERELRRLGHQARGITLADGEREWA